MGRVTGRVTEMQILEQFASKAPERPVCAISIYTTGWLEFRTLIYVSKINLSSSLFRTKIIQLNKLINVSETK